MTKVCLEIYASHFIIRDSRVFKYQNSEASKEFSKLSTFKICLLHHSTLYSIAMHLHLSNK